MNKVQIKKTTYIITETGVMTNGKRFYRLLKGKTEKTLCEGSSGWSLWGGVGMQTTMTVHSEVNFI